MRDIAKNEKCVEEVKQFSACCKANNVFMVVMCRQENTALKDCLTKWYLNEDFKKRCTDEYLKERSEYRSTGIGLKQRKRMASNM